MSSSVFICLKMTLLFRIPEKLCKKKRGLSSPRLLTKALQIYDINLELQNMIRLCFTILQENGVVPVENKEPAKRDMFIGMVLIYIVLFIDCPL